MVPIFSRAVCLPWVYVVCWGQPVQIYALILFYPGMKPNNPQYMLSWTNKKKVNTNGRKKQK